MLFVKSCKPKLQQGVHKCANGESLKNKFYGNTVPSLEKGRCNDYAKGQQDGDATIRKTRYPNSQAKGKKIVYSDS